ncbi:MAG: hypothetical protein ABIG69_02825 [Bacteroidota bacterium]
MILLLDGNLEGLHQQQNQINLMSILQLEYKKVYYQKGTEPSRSDTLAAETGRPAVAGSLQEKAHIYIVVENYNPPKLFVQAKADFSPKLFTQAVFRFS